MSLWSMMTRTASSAILHKWDPPEVFTYGDIVIDSNRPWWGPLMYVGPAHHAPGGVSIAMYLKQPDTLVDPYIPLGYIFVIQNEDMRHAP